MHPQQLLGAPCPVNSAVDLIGSRFDEAVGATWKCAACAPGSVAWGKAPYCRVCPPGTHASSGTCSICGPGRHAPNWGSAECAPCSPGSFAAAPGSLFCLPCPPGFRAGAPGSALCMPGLKAGGSG
ncbi:hypothetical protein Rsub_02493 [Raphidocelis subcapitata]|uniref:Tyrosine-protein kinase ephrin type A/B receptor-like domain-containing protein n=1 Tax=Raphidocelis subcapitata TaxID=307507 RepID=A0A2V0NZP0_9CHLO|nr:hypothetical protein Rsub_02493 [Raphidocelis subcapitata]|eukprot:GBF90387.1 hypothetical protein Rsub_02493 [Raphidocelis subcapitata]